jgi:hypothetical protein
MAKASLHIADFQDHLGDLNATRLCASRSMASSFSSGGFL